NRVFKFGDNAVGEDFAKLNTPLVERVDVPDGALNEDFMLVERDQSAQRLWREPIRENGVRWAVPLKGPVRYLECCNAICRDFLGCFAKCQGLGLGKEVRHQQIVMPAERIQ